MDDLEKEQLAHAKEYLKQVMAGGKSKFMNSFMSMISYGECGEKIDLATGKVAELTPEEIEQVMSHPENKRNLCL